MSKASLIVGNGNWAIKDSSLLGYNINDSNIYSPFPFDVNRLTPATRVDKDGLIVTDEEIVSGELITNGSFATDSDWNKNNWSISNNVASSGNTSSLLQQPTIYTNAIGIYKTTFKARSVNGTSVTLRFYDGGSNYKTFTITSSDFQNFTLTRQRAGVDSTLSFYNNSNAEIEISNVSVVQVNRNNLARIDYLDDAKGVLLTEPQSTNFITDSEGVGGFSTLGRANCVYSLGNGFNSFGSSCSIDVNTFSNNQPKAVINYNAVLGETNLFSFFIKKKSGFYLKITSGNGTNSFTIDLDLSDGSVLNTTGTAINNTNIIQLSDDCFRVEFLTTVLNTTTAGLINLIFYDNSSFMNWSNTNANLSFLISGLQLEQSNTLGYNGEYATSYIPTSGSTVTRNQDLVTNGGEVSTFNSEEGVLFVEIAALANDLSVRIISLSNSTTGERLYLFYNTSSNAINVNYRTGGATVASMGYVVSDITDSHKVAYKWKSGDFSLWIDGVEVATNSNTTMMSANTLNQLAFAQGNAAIPYYGKTKNVQVFKKALSDSELQILTTI